MRQSISDSTLRIVTEIIHIKGPGRSLYCAIIENYDGKLPAIAEQRLYI